MGVEPAVWTKSNDTDGVAAVRRALELGVNFFDVAPVSGLGHAEEVLGRALAHSRGEVMIATKCGLVWDEAGTVTNNLTVRSLHEEIDASLHRLRTRRPSLEESIEVLLALQASGKIRHIGVSNSRSLRPDAS